MASLGNRVFDNGLSVLDTEAILHHLALVHLRIDQVAAEKLRQHL